MALFDAELTDVLGACSDERTGRRYGDRHGCKVRSLRTGFRQTPLGLPRARLRRDGQAVEWQGHLVPRYQRRGKRMERERGSSQAVTERD